MSRRFDDAKVLWVGKSPVLRASPSRRALYALYPSRSYCSLFSHLTWKTDLSTRCSMPKGSHSGKGRRGNRTPQKSRWVANVKTDSTHPPAGLFTKSASIIARSLASKKVSPGGPASGMRMLTFYINRAGRGLTAKRRNELEKAKALLSKQVHRHREGTRAE